MPAAFVFPRAAAFEIAGRYAFFIVLKPGRRMLWTLPGTASLIAFAAPCLFGANTTLSIPRS
jgi:drug/metabolite transporter superfamily protein YnfA